MSRFGDEDPDALDVGVPMNAVCLDCAAPFSRAEDDPGPVWCDACSDTRNRWASALELRTMVTAVLRADPKQIKEVA